MKYFKLKYQDGSFEIVRSKNTLTLIKTYNLATKEHINTIITELQGEQLAIAIANEEN